ncbi:hypothetical protein [Falsiroseomonas sp. HW251]|uniref:hypothetical protein n=1 Tax=Falsiroseomonas sp. HW251 TaxID=3390998 RepID=UPI003D31C701
MDVISNGGRTPARSERGAEVAFLRRTLIVTAVVVLVVLLWWAREAFLLAFGGVVVAVALIAAAEPCKRYLGLGHRAAVATAGGCIFAALILMGILIGGQMQVQVSRLGEALPHAVQAFEGRFGV